MSLRNGSASSTDRTLACPASLVLPRVHSHGTAAARGTNLHAFIQRVVDGMPPADALSLVPEADRPTAACIDWTRLLGGLIGVKAEVAYALDVRARTARWLGNNIGRDYEAAALAHGGPLGEWEVPGSLDITGVDGAGRVIIADVKSGWGHVTAASENGQGLFFAACRMLLDGVDEVEFRVARLKTNGAIYDGDRHVFTRWDIDAFLDEYEAALVVAHEGAALVAKRGTPDVSEGDHCDYCPCYAACPAKTALVRAALPELASIDARIAAMTSEDAGRAFEIAHDRIAPMLERVLKPLKERVHREGFLPLPGGLKIAKSLETSKARFSEALARGLLIQLGATADQMARCYEQGRFAQVRVVNNPDAPKKARKKKDAAALPPMAEEPVSAYVDETPEGRYPF